MKYFYAILAIVSFVMLITTMFSGAKMEGITTSRDWAIMSMVLLYCICCILYLYQEAKEENQKLKELLLKTTKK